MTYKVAVPLLAAVKTTWYQAPGEAVTPVNVLVEPSKIYADILPEARKIAWENSTTGSPSA